MSARPTTRRRGQPLLALILLMVSWVGARAAMWEAPRITAATAVAAQPASASAKPKPISPRDAAPPRLNPTAPKAAPPPAMPGFMPEPASPAETAEPTAPAVASAPEQGAAAPAADPAEPKRELLSPKVALGHQELFSIGMNIPTIDTSQSVDSSAPKGLPMAAAAAAASAQAAPRGSRWSLDAWILLREGGNGFNAPGAGLPGVVVPVGFYGGSQAGAVLRYRLSQTSTLRPTAYLRASSGLEYPRGEEVAAGLSIRPLAKVPVALMAEGRVTRTITDTRVRPAVALVTELPPARLPLGIRGEAYVQAGYVGGKDGTAFVDGQARAERPLIAAGPVRLRAGGGVWGGARKGANRLDVGPTATLSLPIGSGGARVSADYRIRVVGRAAPGSGAVITLSAGF